MAFASNLAVAQDPVKIAPDIYKVSVENDRVRVLDVHIKPGGTIPMHSHPGYVAVALTPCKIKFISPKGESGVAELKQDDVSWRDAEVHSSENVGTAECHALNIELKGLAKKKAPAGKAK